MAPSGTKLWRASLWDSMLRVQCFNPNHQNLQYLIINFLAWRKISAVMTIQEEKKGCIGTDQFITWWGATSSSHFFKI